MLVGAAEPPEPPFHVRILKPVPLYLAGKCRIEAGAFQASGEPSRAVAYMSLSVDGGPARHDGKPPFIWSLDLAPQPRRHRLEVVAVSKDGRKATLAAVSSKLPFLEAVDVNLVLVPVVVRLILPGAPEEGPLVTDLKVGDFEVLEDGSPRPIVSFFHEPLPASVAIALDNSESMEGQFWSARKAVSDFIDSLPAYSPESLLAFNDQVSLVEGFTRDRDKLRAAVAAVRVEGTRTALNEALRVGSLYLAKQAGARVLVLFTDGEDTLDEDGPDRLRVAIDAAQEADVTVFAIAHGTADVPALLQMTRETGGELVRARGPANLQEAFARISESLGSRYVLGFEPADPQREGYRKVLVRVSREKVRVMSRRGYLMRAGE